MQHNINLNCHKRELIDNMSNNSNITNDVAKLRCEAIELDWDQAYYSIGQFDVVLAFEW
jgi:hypothetical protein